MYKVARPPSQQTDCRLAPGYAGHLRQFLFGFPFRCGQRSAGLDSGGGENSFWLQLMQPVDMDVANRRQLCLSGTHQHRG